MREMDGSSFQTIRALTKVSKGSERSMAGATHQRSSPKATGKRRMRRYGKELFIGGLSWDTTDEGLRQAFASYGEITEAKVITDRDTGRSRGFGFVTFAQDDDAKTAISKMDGTSLDGKTLKVNEAQEKSPRGGGRSVVVLGRSWRRRGGRNRW